MKDNCNMILPKLWLERIQCYWDKKIPKDIPETESEFSFYFDSTETKNSVKEMENKLNTEESIITADMVEDGTRLGNYLGTYNVSGPTGVSTLISPVKLSDDIINVLAFHYNEEDKTWNKIENTEIKDGYVYATLESFSPISVFTIKKDSVYYETSDIFNAPIYVANGIPITCKKNENGENVIRTSEGKETIVPNNCTIIGGSIDGTNIESTSIFIDGVTLLYVNAGSFSEKEIVTVKNTSCVIKNSVISSGISGGHFNCRINNAKFDLDNVKSASFTVGQSYWDEKKKDCNKKDDLGLQSNSWLLNADVTINNSNILSLFNGGGPGYFYAKGSNLIAKNSTFEYVITGGSNGRTDCSNAELENCKVKINFPGCK